MVVIDPTTRKNGYYYIMSQYNIDFEFTGKFVSLKTLKAGDMFICNEQAPSLFLKTPLLEVGCNFDYIQCYKFNTCDFHQMHYDHLVIPVKSCDIKVII